MKRRGPVGEARYIMKRAGLVLASPIATERVLKITTELRDALIETLPFMEEFSAAGNEHAPKVLKQMRKALGLKR